MTSSASRATAAAEKKTSSLQSLLDSQEGGGGFRSNRSNQWESRGARSRGGDGRSHRAWEPQQRTSNRGSRWSNAGNVGSSYRSSNTEKGVPPRNSRWANVSEPSPRNLDQTYEERRSKIEQDAIDAAAKQSGKSSSTDDDIATWVGPLIEGKCTYYQDRDKRYPFYCKERGYELLQTLMDENVALLKLNQERIEESAGKMLQKQEVIKNIGKGLYSEKPTLRTKGVTWSTEEYSHPGLQRMYLRMKSIQRFTEIFALLERSANLGVFRDIFERGEGTVRIAAVGGGPGYELLATKLFFQERAPNVDLELICMDVCAAWRPYAEQLGFRFVEYDINQEGTTPLDAAGLDRGELDLCIVSCVMIYVTNDQTLDMFYKLIHDDGVKAILLSERGEKTRTCTMMEDRGGLVFRLIEQTYGVDERQAVLCSNEFQNGLSLSDGYELYQHHPMERTFPNVPYEEHKEQRRKNIARHRS